MKREDLYRNRGMRREQVRARTIGRSTVKSTAKHLYPFLHAAQSCLVLILVILIAGSEFIFPEQTAKQIQMYIQNKMESTLQIPDGEWSGTLKDIFFQEK